MKRTPINPKRSKPRRKRHHTPIPGGMQHNRVKTGVFRDKVYLDLIRAQGLRCAVSGLPSTPDDQIVPAHIGVAGKGIKSPDNECLPMKDSLHRRQHSQQVKMSAHEFWIEVLTNDPCLCLHMVKAYAREFHKKTMEDHTKESAA